VSSACIPSANPVFVVGVFGSGTSFFYSLPNQHPPTARRHEGAGRDFPGASSGRRWRERLL
jgi:hypothetical protein